VTAKVRDIMVREVVTIEANATVRNAVRLMNNCEIGCLIVLQEGKPTGIVTERDMINRVLLAGRDPRAVEVGGVMSKPLLSLEPEKEIEDAVMLMFKHKIKKLPIIENGRLVGVVTLTDLIRSPEVTKWLRAQGERTMGEIDISALLYAIATAGIAWFLLWAAYEVMEIVRFLSPAAFTNIALAMCLIIFVIFGGIKQLKNLLSLLKKKA